MGDLAAQEEYQQVSRRNIVRNIIEAVVVKLPYERAEDLSRYGNKEPAHKHKSGRSLRPLIENEKKTPEKDPSRDLPPKRRDVVEPKTCNEGDKDDH